MTNEVYANGREIACKAASGKAIAAFPDVCMTPPENPATPPGVPVPYPNTGMASDTTDGSTTVQISGKEVLLKDKSHFKKSSGDEPGSAAKKGVVTSVNRGKVYFTAWSMDVKFEGLNVVRHLDMTTHNHASQPSNTAPWLYLDEAATGKTDECADVRKGVDSNCTEKEFKKASPDCSPACCEAKKCVLAPYGSGMKCCDGKTKHHIVPDHCFKQPGESGTYYPGVKDMSYGKGLGICVSGEDKADSAGGQLLEHGKIHDDFARIENEYRDSNNGRWTFEEASAVGADVCGFHTGCDPDCLAQQTQTYYADKGVGPKTQLRANAEGQGVNPPAAEMGSPNANWSTRYDD